MFNFQYYLLNYYQDSNFVLFYFLMFNKISISKLQQYIEDWDIESNIKRVQKMFNYNMKQFDLPKNSQIFKLCILHCCIKTIPNLIKNGLNNVELVILNTAIKQAYNKIFSEKILLRGKYHLQFQILTLIIVKVIYQFLSQHFNLKENIESQIFIVLTYTMIGLQVEPNCYHIQSKKYMKQKQFFKKSLSSLRTKPQINLSLKKSLKNKQRKVQFNTQKIFKTKKQSICFNLQEIRNIKRRTFIGPKLYQHRGSILQNNKTIKLYNEQNFHEQLKRNLKVPSIKFVKPLSNLQISEKTKTYSSDSIYETKKIINSKQNSIALTTGFRQNTVCLPQNIKNLKIHLQNHREFNNYSIQSKKIGNFQNETVNLQKGEQKTGKLGYNEWRQIIDQMKAKIVKNQVSNKELSKIIRDSACLSQNCIVQNKKAKINNEIAQIQNNQLRYQLVTDDNLNKKATNISEEFKEWEKSKNLKPHILKKCRKNFFNQCKKRRQHIKQSQFYNLRVCSEY